MENPGDAVRTRAAEKQKAADELQFGNVVKITLVFRKQWWPKANFGFIQAPEEPIPT